MILRRVYDKDCDPLELRGDSVLGPAGLLQAVRGRGVAVANALGSSIVENPALLAFLPGLCRHFLGEDLRLPSVATWWCGGISECEYVIANLDRLVIRCTLPGHNPQMGALLDQAARTELISCIRANPHLYVGRESIILSTAPVLEEGRLVPRQLVLRGFAVADAENYQVMPGGLARVFPALNEPKNAARQGGISKDVWVLAATPQQHVGRLHQTHGPVVITRDGGDLPSRVAENLYWLGRYGERPEGTSRLLREALIRLMEQERDATEEHCLEDLLTALKLDLPPIASPHARFLAIRGALHALITDPAHGEGLPAIFAGMFRTGRAVRDHLGDDDWRILNRLQQHLQDIPGGLSTGSARELLEGNLTLLAAFYGLCNGTMPHHYGWLFLDIGRYLERVQNTLALLKLAFVTALRPGIWLWEVVLTSIDNLTAYQRRYRSELHPTAILDLLLFDKGNPRAVGYQLRRLQTQIDRLPHQRSTPYRSAEERLILEAVSILQLADIEHLATLERSGRRRNLLSY